MRDKPIVLVVEGRRIEATRIPVKTRAAFWRRQGADEPEQVPDERSRYAVTVDGVLRGHLVYPLGWGGDWQVWSLGRRTRSVEDVGTPARLSPTLGRDNRFTTKEKALATVLTFMQAGKMPSRREIVTLTIEAEEDRARRILETAERNERWEREAAERKARDEVRRKVEAEQRASDLETLEGLLARRHVAGLSNAEADLLDRLAAQMRGKA